MLSICCASFSICKLRQTVPPKRDFDPPKPTTIDHPSSFRSVCRLSPASMANDWAMANVLTLIIIGIYLQVSNIEQLCQTRFAAAGQTRWHAVRAGFETPGSQCVSSNADVASRCVTHVPSCPRLCRWNEWENMDDLTGENQWCRTPGSLSDPQSNRQNTNCLHPCDHCVIYLIRFMRQICLVATRQHPTSSAPWWSERIEGNSCWCHSPTPAGSWLHSKPIR